MVGPPEATPPVLRAKLPTTEQFVNAQVETPPPSPEDALIIRLLNTAQFLRVAPYAPPPNGTSKVGITMFP